MGVYLFCRGCSLEESVIECINNFKPYFKIEMLDFTKNTKVARLVLYRLKLKNLDTVEFLEFFFQLAEFLEILSKMKHPQGKIGKF